MNPHKPKVAIYKFASCDGCQLSLLDAEDELLAVAGAIDISYFPEASRKMVRGPYDIGVVEGSVTIPHDVERIRAIRKECRTLITIGANPEYISALDRSLPIGSFVHVDFELRGCPINKFQLIEVIVAHLHKRKPNIPSHSVCIECKLKGNVCVMVSSGTFCLGPVTQVGCGALCPSFQRGCYGCFGPMDSANTASLSKQFVDSGATEQEIKLAFRNFNAYAEAFRRESDSHE